MINRIPNIKTIKIGDRTFNVGKVYSNPLHKAFASSTNEKQEIDDSSKLKEESPKDKWYLDYNNGR